MRLKNFTNIKKPILIAEIGNNHEGSYKLAKKMIYLAYKSEADGVKFQTFKTHLLQSKLDSKRYKKLKSFELNETEFVKLSRYAKSLGLLFLSTPFDLKSADFLNKIVDVYKIASGDNNFFPLIKKVISKKKPVIISLGFLNIKEINRLKDYIIKLNGKKFFYEKIAFLHCISSYPTSLSEVNLKSMLTIKRTTGATIGYSDHTIGINAANVAVSIGAKIIEKHFTLNKNYSTFRDHKLSSDPKEMKELSSSISKINSILGSSEKKISPSEKSNLNGSRRSLYAFSKLKKKQKITLDDLVFLRPRTGEDISEYQKILGKKLKKDIHKGNLILKKDLR